MSSPQRDQVLEAKSKGPVSPNSSLMRAYKASLPALSSMLLQVAIGNMLGDAYLQPNAKGTEHRLRFEWGGVNKDYMQHVFGLFMPYCITLPRTQVRTNALGNLVTTWPFQTVFHPAFNILADIFIVNGKKCINVDKLLPVFTPVSLAYWFMDDGGTSYDRYGMTFHTQGFKPEEVEQLCMMLTQLYGLLCWVKISKGKPVLVISGNSYDKFFSLVSPHIVPSMRRKFPQLSRTQWNLY